MLTPTLMQSEEERAPWNEKTKKIEVTISECLSSTQEIEVPDNFEYNEEVIKQIVKDTIMLPSDYLVIENDYDWNVDSFCVV